ncbi:hypothetical protein CLV42_11152 [Chitinophaga ginsengisoli]|uniref:Uncharacterized protein n=1 Tax=Chitinophaga ginsengisoli TaxID=363837 RepID=A0A2P8FXA9_9BACT|nr:hypothetical protein CLV42_11152 [Chitinophaga ginsengisoli]
MLEIIKKTNAHYRLNYSFDYMTRFFTRYAYKR